MPTTSHNAIDAARMYLSRGWSVVPIPKGCKGPIARGWQHLRLTHESAAREVAPDGNVGLILGEPSGWLVDIDLDCDEARDMAYHYLPATVITGRHGNPASHWWYICEGAITTKFTRDDDSGRAMICELRSTGCQTVVGPSVHPEGGRYDMLEGEPTVIGFDELLAAVQDLAKACGWEEKPHKQAPNWTMRRIEPAPMSLGSTGYGGHALQAECQRVAGAMEGTRNDTLNTAAFRMAQLVAGGELDEGDVVEGLRQAAALCGLGEAEAAKTIQSGMSAGLKFPREREERIAAPQHHDPEFELAMDLTGWLTPAKGEEDGATESHVVAGRVMTMPAFPEHLLEVPGLVGEVMRYNLTTAHRPHPILALAGALSLQAVLASRWVQDDAGNKTNLYVIGLAGTGAGKEHARKINSRILHLAGADDLEGPDSWASDAGMVTAVHKQPGIMFQVDELGQHLRTMRAEMGSPHLFGIATNLLRFYSLADGVFRGKAYADADRNLIIDQPCVVLHGTSTLETFWPSLASQDLHSGLVGRMCIFTSPGRPEAQYPKATEVPESIIDAARHWRDKHRVNNGLLTPSTGTVTDEAIEVFQALGREADEAMRLAEEDSEGESMATVRARDHEKARRLALVYACSTWNPSSPSGPIVDAQAATWACDLVRYQTAAMLAAADVWVADSLFDARQKRVLRTIEKTRAKGVTKHQLSRATQALSVRERTEVIENLIQSGRIVMVESREGTRGPATVRFVSERFV